MVEEGGRGQSIINSIHMYLDSMEIEKLENEIGPDTLNDHANAFKRV
jgi:hypothetical protein